LRATKVNRNYELWHPLAAQARKQLSVSTNSVNAIMQRCYSSATTGGFP
jgi:hypothetical protein